MQTNHPQLRPHPPGPTWRLTRECSPSQVRSLLSGSTCSVMGKRSGPAGKHSDTGGTTSVTSCTPGAAIPAQSLCPFAPPNSGSVASTQHANPPSLLTSSESDSPSPLLSHPLPLMLPSPLCSAAISSGTRLWSNQTDGRRWQHLPPKPLLAARRLQRRQGAERQA